MKTNVKFFIQSLVFLCFPFFSFGEERHFIECPFNGPCPNVKKSSYDHKIELLVPRICRKIPHQLPAFTQGLAFDDHENLLESCGLYFSSSLRIIDPESGKIKQMIRLNNDVFAEGVAAFPEQIIQLTWHAQKAFVYDPFSLTLKKILSYSGQGWGLCRDGNTIWMTNGSSKLYQRDALNFFLLKTLNVNSFGCSIPRLNDLECVDNELFINVWKKNLILRVDKLSGKVTGVIDASALLSRSEKSTLSKEEVLNGIAYNSKKGTFFLTGKGWPWIYEVYFVSP